MSLLVAALGCDGTERRAGVDTTAAGTGGSSGMAPGSGGAAGQGGSAGQSDSAGQGGSAGEGATAGEAGVMNEAGAPPDVPLGIAAIARGDNVFVAVGSVLTGESQTGIIFRSNDGIMWTEVAKKLAVLPQDVEFGNGHFVVLGYTFDPLPAILTPAALVSDDGADWDQRSVPASRLGDHFAFGNGVFVAAGEEGHLSSVDGKAWKKFGPREDASQSNVEFAGGEFVSWRRERNDVLHGSGDTFNPTTVDTSGLLALRALNSGFVAITMYDCCFGEIPEAVIYRSIASADGVDWAAGEGQQDLPPLPVIDDGAVCVAFRSLDVLGGPSCDELHVVLPGFRPQAALEADGRYFVTGEGSSGIVSSSDGITWTKVL
jgi:hypothetical protein